MHRNNLKRQAKKKLLLSPKKRLQSLKIGKMLLTILQSTSLKTRMTYSIQLKRTTATRKKSNLRALMLPPKHNLQTNPHRKHRLHLPAKYNQRRQLLIQPMIRLPLKDESVNESYLLKEKSRLLVKRECKILRRSLGVRLFVFWDTQTLEKRSFLTS